MENYKKVQVACEEKKRKKKSGILFRKICRERERRTEFDSHRNNTRILLSHCGFTRGYQVLLNSFA